MLFEIKAFNAKGTVFRVILDPEDVEMLDRMLEAVDHDTVVQRDEREEEKINTVCIVVKALNALSLVEEQTRKEAKQ